VPGYDKFSQPTGSAQVVKHHRTEASPSQDTLG
jgi:hypothetical protein